MKINYLVFLLLLPHFNYPVSYSVTELQDNIKEWATSDRTFLEKCNDVIHLYGRAAGSMFSYFGKKIIDYDIDRCARLPIENSPEDKFFSIAMKKTGSFFERHGNYLENKANFVILLLHAYISFRIIQETIRYCNRVSGIIGKQPKPDKEEGDLLSKDMKN